jgi:hypothetical protein
MKSYFKIICLFAINIFFVIHHLNAQVVFRTMKTDVLVIGGGTGGIAAAIQCARLGVKTILTEETKMLGGMLTAAGVSCTDGNDQLNSGIWEEFRQALYSHYKRNKLNSGWVSNTNFEPHVGDSIFKSWAGNEKNLDVFFNQQFIDVIKKDNKINGAVFLDKDGNKIFINAKIIIDGTELGDVFAKTDVSYDLGMDDPGISSEKEARRKNNIIQDLTWAAVLKDYGDGADKTIKRPFNYDSTKYFCSTADAPCTGKPYPFDTKKVLDYGKLPRSPGATQDKFMLNWPVHGNDFYLNVVESKNELRVKGYELAKQQTLGFIYFLQTALGMKHIGLADDELDGGMALIPYNREGRRVKGIVRLNINHLKNSYDYSLYKTGISVGDYPVDHHHAQFPGKVPEIEFPKIPAFNIPLGCLIPEKTEGLLVCEKGISVSNIVNGSTRLQPVVLLTGQAAGVIAAKSIIGKQSVKDISVRAIQDELLKLKCYLLPFVDVKSTDQHWEAIQKIGLTGILKGKGISEGWENKTYFYPDSTIKYYELEDGFYKFYKGFSANRGLNTKEITFESLVQLIERVLNMKKKGTVENKFSKDEKYYGDRNLTRKEIAWLINKYLDPFSEKINLHGKLVRDLQ